jgi:hypothetical protein
MGEAASVGGLVSFIHVDRAIDQRSSGMAAADESTSRRKIDVCSIVIDRAGEAA